MDFFTEEEMRVYSYHDGGSMVRADPLEIRHAIIVATEGGIDDILSSCVLPPDPTPGDRLRVEDSRKRLDDVTREAFRLKPFDPATGAGCTTAMVRRVWNHYAEYVRGKGQADAGSSASPPSTGSPTGSHGTTTT